MSGPHPTTDAERLARVSLSVLGEPGLPRLTTDVLERGPEATLESLHSRDSDDPRVREAQADVAARLAGIDPAQVLERAARDGIRFVVPGDAEWPPALDELAHVRPLHERGGLPVGLWLRGRASLTELTAQAVAVVGSRAATDYGAVLARDIAAGVARAGFTVVSGAAFGIDQAAHRGALSVEGGTVAVLACGADRHYPAAHRSLIDYVADVGLVVSETAPGGAPMRTRFLARNRLIAALSQGTVVVEAAVRSGALNTASWAGALGRHVMAVPGPVTSAASEGAHQLIRARDALLVTRTEEVLEAVGPMGLFTLAEPRQPAQPRDLLPAGEQRVLDAVPVQVGADLHNIARTAGLAPDRVRRLLGVLRETGFVESSGDRWRLAEKALPPP